YLTTLTTPTNHLTTTSSLQRSPLQQTSILFPYTTLFRSSLGRVSCVGAAWSGLLLHHDEETEGRAGRRDARKAFAIACLITIAGARGLCCASASELSARLRVIS